MELQKGNHTNLPPPTYIFISPLRYKYTAHFKYRHKILQGSNNCSLFLVQWAIYSSNLCHKLHYKAAIYAIDYSA